VQSDEHLLTVSRYVERNALRAGLVARAEHESHRTGDARRSLETYKARSEVALLPLYTTEEGGSVLISSDTWPSSGGTLGLTRAQIAEARAKNVRPAGGGGFAYMQGPDNALVEYAGDYPAERFNHVHLYEEDPFCALLWYQRHLNAPLRAGFAPTAHSEADCKVARGPERTWPALDRAARLKLLFTALFHDAGKPATSQQDVVTQTQALRQQISGVDLNAEATTLLQLQSSYQAASKMVTVIDSLTQTILQLIQPGVA